MRNAKVGTSVGIVAGTDDDITNLSIAVTARELNPRLFTILRQNLQANRPLFSAYQADILMVSPEIIADECLALIHTPLLGRFLAVVRAESDAWADAVIERLKRSLGEDAPEIWSVALNAADAPALHRALLFEGATVTVGDLRRDPSSRDQRLACEALHLLHDAKEVVLPGDETALAAGDQVLFAGTPAARDAQWPLLRNLNVRDYVLKGVDVPGGWLWEFGVRARSRFRVRKNRIGL